MLLHSNSNQWCVRFSPEYPEVSGEMGGDDDDAALVDDDNCEVMVRDDDSIEVSHTENRN